MGQFETKLAELGVTLPEAPLPAANYVPYVQSGTLLHVSGQISKDGDTLITGKLGADLDVAAGAAAAKVCAIALLAQVKAACGGDLDRLVRVVKLGGFVNSTPEFTEQPQVINGASDFLGEALGEAGQARALGRVGGVAALWRGGGDRRGLRDQMSQVPLPASFLTTPLAHRALHDVAQGRPENSRAAIRAAIARGYGIEIDLQPSRDGAAMVFHDYDMGRLTGRAGPIRLQSAAELAKTPLLGGDEGVPGLDEVLDLVAGRVPLLIELKDQHGQMGATDGGLERAVAAALAGYRGDVALMSFNPQSVIQLAELCPDLPRGIVTSAYRAEGLAAVAGRGARQAARYSGLCGLGRQFHQP